MGTRNFLSTTEGMEDREGRLELKELSGHKMVSLSKVYKLKNVQGKGYWEESPSCIEDQVK